MKPKTDGEQLKLFGMELVRNHTPEYFKEFVRRAVGRLASSGKDFTAEDVREITGDPPNHPNAFGAAFSSALKQYSCHRVGIKKALRASAHSRLLPVYRR